MRLTKIILLSSLLASPAAAQVTPQGTFQNTTGVTPANSTPPTNTGWGIPSVNMFCADGLGNAKVCSFGSGGSGSSGGTAAQQTPAGDAAVSVAASTSTLVWNTSSAARVLRIVPNNSSCFMRTDGGTASASSTPIPGGYVFNLVEPPPAANITVFCPAAANIAVSQGN